MKAFAYLRVSGKGQIEGDGFIRQEPKAGPHLGRSLLLELSTQKKKLETIISCIANGIMVTNKNLEVVLHNPALLRLLDVTAPMAHPVPVDAVVKDDSLIETLKTIQRLQFGH